MKKLLSFFMLVLMIAVLTVSALAANSFVGEKEFTLASYNGVSTFAKTGGNIEALEDSTYWVLDNAKTYNTKYVSFVGQIGQWAPYRYASVGANDSVLADKCLSDPGWNAIFKNFGNVVDIFVDEEMPLGVSASLYDYLPDGRNRTNLAAEYLPVDSRMLESYTTDYIDEFNSYYVVENNGVKYIVFNLELWPRTAVLDWVKDTIAANPDKYVIIYTTSFIDDTAKMYTMWDWAEGFKPAGVTTSLKAYNLTNIDKARDGEGIWNYALAQFDNVLAIISANIKNADILTSKVKNERGHETALIAANADISRNYQGVSLLYTKFSEDNKTITCAWATAGKGIDEKSIKTINLDSIGTLKEATTNDSLPQIPVQYNGANKAYILGYEGNLFKPNNNMTRAEACTIFARLLLGVQDIPAGYTTRFEDVQEGAWYYNAIAYLDETGFFFRNKNTTYKPNEPITRAEFVELANSASSLRATKTVSFNDVPADHYYYDAIMAAASSGLVNGYEDNTFRPDNTITRAEVVTVINRLLGLKVSARTVDETKVENEFKDISSHWGKPNILMASNSDVHGAYYYNLTGNGITETSKSYTFANKHVSITIDKKTSKVLEMVNLKTGENVLGSTANMNLLYLVNEKGSNVICSKLETVGNRIKFTFKNKVELYLIVDVHDNFITFEIDSELPKTIKSVTFGNLVMKSAHVQEGYLLNGISMAAWVNPVYKGYNPNQNATIAHAYTIYDTGVMGSKLGIVFSAKEDAIPFLQEVMDNIDKSVGLVSKAGGAYAQEFEGNHGDYAFCTNLDPENLDVTIALLKELDVDQYDYHQSTGNTFTQGDFTFAHTESGTATEFYEKYGKKFNEAGVDLALHTYAYYIAPGSTKLLSDPKWHKDLEFMPDEYTTRKLLSKTNRNVATVEDATDFNANAAFFIKTSKYILIDEEIIMVQQGTKSGFINCTRGALGTTPAIHQAGSKIRHLSGYFSMLTPKLGSDLFYHIADLTAKAYNEGGFVMLYIDAIDGLSRHIPEGHEVWYYFHMFLHRIVSQCNVDPIVETSSGAPSEWNVRGRQGAWDYSNYSIKKFNANHVAANLSSMKTNMTATLGWFNFFPDGNPYHGMKNTFHKTMFRDDLDFVGMNAIIHDMSMVYNPFSVSSINNNPFHKANILYYYNMYSKLRKSHYFSDEVIEKVKSIGGEWKVVETKPGVYAFQQMYYQYGNFGNAQGVTDYLNGQNIFVKQSPFIRIEARYSTLFENPTTMIDLDPSKEVGAKMIKTFGGFNMIEKGMVVSVKVKGTGADGDAMLLSFAYGANGESDGRRDHFIDLNYEGWRDFVFIDVDNADYDVNKYKFDGISTTGASYATYRFSPSPYAIDRFTVRTTGATGAKAMIDDVIVYPHSDAPVKNPTVTVGAQSMTFNCEMKGGEYLEYDPTTNKAILYHNHTQTTEEVTFTGKLEIAGYFDATYSAESLTNAPLRGRVVFGFYGQQLAN